MSNVNVGLRFDEREREGELVPDLMKIEIAERNLKGLLL